MNPRLLVLFFCFITLSTPPSGLTSYSQAASFKAADLQGTFHSLEQYQGQTLVLYFWATWCPACRKEVKKIIKLYQRFHPGEMKFVSVSLDTDLKKLEKFVKDHQVPYPVLFDGKGWENAIAESYGIVSTPTFVLINPKGEIVSSGSWSSDLTKLLQKSS